MSSDTHEESKQQFGDNQQDEELLSQQYEQCAKEDPQQGFIIYAQMLESKGVLTKTSS